MPSFTLITVHAQPVMRHDPLNIFTSHLDKTITKSLMIRRFQLAWFCRNVIKGALLSSLGYLCQNFSALLEAQRQFWMMACLPTSCLSDGVFCMCRVCVCLCVCLYMYIYNYIYTHTCTSMLLFLQQAILFGFCFVFSLDHRFCLTNFCLCKTKQKYANI